MSTIDNDPNLNINCQTIQVYLARDDDEKDPVDAIEKGLSEALFYYYPLAGRLTRHDGDGRLRVNCTGEGVPFTPASADCTLASLDHLNHISVEDASRFVPQAAGVTGCHLMMQVTRFACGGFTVGMSLSHAVCDGFGANQFFRAVAELASGRHDAPTVKPVWERDRLVGTAPPEHLAMPFPVDKSSLASSPLLPSTDLVQGSFDVDAESLRRLKTVSCESLTTLEVLGAFVWRAKFRALEMNLDGNTQFALSIGIRSVISPPLTDGYYGNACVSSLVIMTGRELCEGPLSKVAMMIKESKRTAGTAGYVWSWLGIMERVNQEKKKIEENGASLIVTDWRHLGLLEADFGWKSSVNVVPVPWGCFGSSNLSIFLPPFCLDKSMEGGLRVHMCLPRIAMARFEEEMELLKQN
ncbi:3'-N-debenzoyl-2'-deoxytaxol N-benzoyltransferase [Acorus calamus]|uniref:3'-N-debenzoyl-2'-deoxytaxol N-benzoyltransferase n=1 Tax=Acorus calamus TaxID=4465 RepID=A0AAV9CJY9_ACOCL|nr:3'-N-debenzoyl-2'-deoxytaxol N-benzoyltransferase [Acorus calamus]